jgi:hypothetical protein
MVMVVVMVMMPRASDHDRPVVVVMMVVMSCDLKFGRRSQLWSTLIDRSQDSCSVRDRLQ